MIILSAESELQQFTLLSIRCLLPCLCMYCTTARTHIHGTYSHSLQVFTSSRTYIHFTAVCASFVQDSSPGDDTYPHVEAPIAGATEGGGEGEGEGGLGSLHSPVAARCRRGVEGALHRGAEAVKARCRDALGVCESLCRQLSSSVRFTDGHRLTWRGRGRGNEAGTVAYPNSADHGMGDGDVDIEAAAPASQQRAPPSICCSCGSVTDS